MSGPGERFPATERGDDFLAGRDHDDVFPWAFSRYLDADGGKDGIGSITTPNGRRPDGRSHTYWMVAGGVWEPDALLICNAVNAYVAKGWRGWIIRRLSHFGRRLQ